MRPTLLAVALLFACGPSRPPPQKPPPPPAPTPCTPSTCNGCCVDGTCIRAPSDDYCGGGGLACFACPEGTRCGVNRACEAELQPPPVQASVCPLVFEPVGTDAHRELKAVWASGSNAWAVGPDGALTLSNERFVRPANDSAIGGQLRAVWATDDARAVWLLRAGTTAAIRRELNELALDEASPISAELFAIWGRSAADVYVGGGNADGHIAHWDGTGWRTARVADSAILGLAAWRKTNVFAVTATELLVEEAGAFSSLGRAPGPLTGALFPVGPRDVWLGGNDGKLRRFTEGQWTELTVSPSPVTAFWAASASLLFFSTAAGGVGMFDGNQVAWLPFGDAKLLAMAGNGAGAVLAVGHGIAMRGRCARPGELPENTVVSVSQGGEPVRDDRHCDVICTHYTTSGACQGTRTVCL